MTANREGTGCIGIAAAVVVMNYVKERWLADHCHFEATLKAFKERVGAACNKVEGKGV